MLEVAHSPVTYKSRIVLTWVSAADGTANETLAHITGTLMRVEFVPGSPAPTAAYDITLKDEYLVDVLSGQGANLSESTPTDVMPGLPLKDGTTTSVSPRFIDNVLTLAVTNAGNAKAGTVILYFA